MSSTMTRSTSTIVTSSSGDELSPIERAIMDACNELHAARDEGDAAAPALLAARLDELLRRYDETDGENHPNPAWARPSQRALALSAMGQIDRAISLELTALKYADTPRRVEISCGNIADRLIRSGEPARAVEFFLEAHAQSPDSVPILLTGAVALAESGYEEQAHTILRTLAENPGLMTPDSELGAYLDLDPRVRALASSLDAGRELLARWGSVRAAIGGAS